VTVLKGYRQRIVILLLVTSTTRFYNGMGVHLKKNLRPIPDLTACPSIPAVREPIFVAILLNLLRKRRVTMEDVKFSKVRQRWTNCRNGDLPLVSLLRIVHA
jgi:hypothetical protein